MLKVLIVGSGGREHAVVKALIRTAETPISFIYLSTTENPILTKLSAPNPPIIVETFSMPNLSKVMPKILAYSPHYAIIGPEAPLEKAYTDLLEANNISTIGPTRENAQIETSKHYCRKLLASSPHLAKHQPKFRYYEKSSSENIEDSIEYITSELENRYVIKQDGLCGGKGVVVSGEHIHTKSEAIAHLSSLTTPYLIEEKLQGEEFSLITLTDGTSYLHFPPVQDFKRLNNNNMGPNTGSMGSYTLADHTLPFLTNEDLNLCKNINEQTVKHLNANHNKRYKGFLYGSFMKTPTNELKIIEYNARLGDPEAINLMELVNINLSNVFMAVKLTRLGDITPTLAHDPFKHVSTVCRYLVPEGYPKSPLRNFRISLSEKIPENALIMASVKQTTNIHGETYYEGLGSRTLAIITSASTIKAAKTKNDRYISHLPQSNPLHYRTDIGNIFTTQTKLQTTPQTTSQTKSAYESSGVSIDEGNKVVEAIKSSIMGTYTENTINNFGDFGGLYRISPTRTLVASTDGVGTKTEHLRQILKGEEPALYRILGKDIVNHCVNDILVKNAKPLFFLDYFATSSLDHKHVQYLVQGIAEACRLTGTALLGGETAEMPSVYTKGAFDIAGTIVGETSPKTMFDGKRNLTEHTKILYLKSNGPHTNGYSLIRSAYKNINKDTLSESDATYLNRFTYQPHRCYLNEINTLLENTVSIQALCHITGGGLIDNPERVAPSHLETVLDTEQILQNMPKGFKLIQYLGNVTSTEMLRVFNCGVGMLIYLDETETTKALKLLPELREIGYMRLKRVVAATTNT